MNRNNIALTILAVVALIWVVNALFTAARATILDLAEPALKASNDITKKVASFLIPETGLSRENARLKDRVEALEGKLARLDELASENERLRALLDFKSSLNYKTILAQVIGRDPSSWTSIIYIDKGEGDGIKKYMAVTTDEGLAGRVLEAGSSSAKVILLNDPDSRIGALVQRTRHDGLLYGTLTMRCLMVYISLDADIWPGDLVVTSGSGGTIPKGLVVGKIEDVFIDKSGLYQSAVVRPAVEMSKIEEVLCVE